MTANNTNWGLLVNLAKKDDQRAIATLYEMIASLSEEQRLCIYLYYIQDMSVKDIARQAGVSENTVKSRLKYGRAGRPGVRLLFGGCSRL